MRAPNINVSSNLFIESNAVLEISGELKHDGTAIFNKDVYFRESMMVVKDIIADGNVISKNDMQASNNLLIRKDAIIEGNLSLDRKASFCNDGITLAKDVLFEREFNILRLATFTDDVLLKRDMRIERNIRQEFGQHTALANLNVMDEATFQHVTVRGRFDIQSQLVLNAMAVFKQGFRVENTDVSLDQGLLVQNDVAFSNDLYVKNNIDVAGDLDIRDKAIFSNHGLTLKKDTVFERDTDTLGIARFSNDVIMNANLNAHGDITQSSSKVTELGELKVIKTSILQNVIVKGFFEVENGFKQESLGSTFRFKNGIRVEGDETAADIDALYVRKQSTFNDDVTFRGDIYADNDVNIDGTTSTCNLIVHGDISADTNLKIMRDGSILQNLTVEKKVVFNDNLRVKSNVVFEDDLHVENKIDTRSIEISDDAKVMGTLNVSEEIHVYEGRSNLPSYSWKEDNSTGFFLPEQHQLGISTYGQERLRIADNGYVGINVQKPEYFLDVDGNITARAPFLSEKGVETQPAYSFKEGESTGMYLENFSGDLAFTREGNYKGSFDTRGFNVNGKIHTNEEFYAQNGREGLPTYTFIEDVMTGMFLQNSNELAFTTNGVSRGSFDEEGLTVNGMLILSDLILTENGSSNAPIYTFQYDQTTGVYLDKTNVLAFSTDGQYRGSFDNQGLDVYGDFRATGQFLAEAGSMNMPIYTFKEESNTGVYLTNTSELSFSTAGVYRGRFDLTGMDVQGMIRASEPFMAEKGSPSFPTYTFKEDSNTGLYLDSTDKLCISTGGKERVVIYEEGMEIRGDLWTRDIHVSDGSSFSPTYSFNESSTGFYLNNGVLSFSVNTVDKLKIDDVGIKVLGELHTDDIILNADGQYGHPSYSFQNNSNTGIYLDDEDLCIVRNTENVGVYANDGFHIARNAFINDAVLTGDGTSEVPTHTFNTEKGTGLYLHNGINIGFTVNKIIQSYLDQDGMELIGNLRIGEQIFIADGTINDPAYTFTNKNSTGMFLKESDIGFTHDAVNIMNITSEGLHILKKMRVDDQVSVHDGNRTSPAYSFESQKNTGLYLNNADNLGFSLTDTEEMSLSRIGLNVNRAIYSSNNIESDGQFKGPNRDKSSPTYSFDTASNTGIYLNNVENIGFSLIDTEEMTLSANGLNVNRAIYSSNNMECDGQFKGPNRDKSSPTYSFDNADNTGMYLNDENNLGFSLTDTEEMSLSVNGLNVNRAIYSSNNIESDGQFKGPNRDKSSPTYSFDTASNTGIYLNNIENIGFSLIDTEEMTLSANGLNVNRAIYSSNNIESDGQFKGPNKNKSSPTYSFDSADNTGMFLNDGNNLGFSLTDTEEMSLTTSGLNVNRAIYSSNNIESDGQFKGPNKNKSNPTYSFDSAGNTGMYLNDGNNLGFSLTDTEEMSLSTGGLYVNRTIYSSNNIESDGQFKGPNRNTSSPTYSFDNAGSTGIYLDGNDLAFSIGNARKGYFNGSGLIVNGSFKSTGDAESDGQFKGPNRNTSSPTYSFDNAGSTGIYLDGNDLAFSIGNNRKGYFNSSGMVVEGTITSTENITSQDDVIAQSDRRSKYDIENIPNALDKILALQGVSFKRNKDNSDSIGFIAQDVQPILPEVVKTNPDTGLLGVNYGVITALLVEGIKELATKNKRPR